MTNADAARYFASLPAEQSAEVAIVNIDTQSVNLYDLSLADKDSLEEEGIEEAEDAIGKPAIYLKW